MHSLQTDNPGTFEEYKELAGETIAFLWAVRNGWNLHVPVAMTLVATTRDNGQTIFLIVIPS